MSLRKLDVPPLWLVLSLATTWLLSLLWAPLGGAPWQWLGAALILAGLALAVWAAIGFRRARTTIVPREEPSALVSAGPFRFSRNPIYLANLVILSGWSLWLGTPLGLLLVWPLKVLLERRFVLPEERMLEDRLGQAYTGYRRRVRRWL